MSIKIITVGLLVLMSAASHADTLGLLVTPKELSDYIESNPIRIIDSRDRARQYRRSHIPGAIFIPIETVFDRIDGVKGRLPPVDQVVAAFENAGIGTETPVIVYDASDGLWASRFFWALEYLGHKSVHLLEGGFEAWRKQELAVSGTTPEYPPAHFDLDLRNELMVSSESMLQRVNDDGIVIVDSRSQAEHIGRKSYSKRKGRIPASINVDWEDHLADGSSFLPVNDLELLYSDRGISRDDTIITYCQAGVRAAHAYFTLRLLGYSSVALYDDSWEYWGNVEETPIEK